MNRELRIIYMGTPVFAVEPLRAIISAGYNVLAVVTVPDKPSGRGQKIQSSPVKEYALINHIPVIQPISLKSPDFVDELKRYNANLQIVVAFRMLPEVVWQMPEFGTLNLHASILPQYRGAAPINHALMNGETETGLTTFFIEKEIDTGKIILTRRIPIQPSDDAGILHDRLMYAGGEVLSDTLKLIETGEVKAQSQDDIIADNIILNPAPKIFKNDCRINWAGSCQDIHNLVRGLSPFPGAFSNFISADMSIKQIKIFKTSYELSDSKRIPGTIVTDKKLFLKVIARDGIVTIEELQIEGKKRMCTTEFLRGINLSDNTHFEV